MYGDWGCASRTTYMIEAIKKWVKDAFTEPNNKTVCPIRVAAVVSLLQYHSLATANYIQHHVFDAQSYAVGCATLIGAAGVALGLKKDSPTQP